MSKATWDPQLAKRYRTMPPPGPPSPSELKVYERFVKRLENRSDAKVLILGSTPGLRSLCVKYQLPYLCVDYHPENFRISATAIKPKDKKGLGQLLISDWRKMKLPEKYNLILGDIAFGMIPWQTLDKMLRCLVKALKPKGMIVHRTWMRGKGHFQDLEKYLKTEHHKRRKQMSAFTSLVIPFVHYFYQPRKELIKFSQNIPKLKPFVEKGLLPPKDYQIMDYYYSRYKMPNYYPLAGKYNKKLRKYFKIKTILHGQDWFKDYAPIYILTKKR